MPDNNSDTTIGPVEPQSVASELLEQADTDHFRDTHAYALADIEAFSEVTADLEGIEASLRGLCIRTTFAKFLNGMPVLFNERLRMLFSETAAFRKVVSPVLENLEQGNSISDEQLEQTRQAYVALLATPTYRAYFASLILKELDSDHPGDIHFAYADRVIGEDSSFDEETRKELVRKLAGKLCDGCRELNTLVTMYRRTVGECEGPEDSKLPDPEFDAPFVRYDPDESKVYAGSYKTGELGTEGAAVTTAMLPRIAPKIGENKPVLWLDAAAIEWAANGFDMAPNDHDGIDQPFGSVDGMTIEEMHEDARARWDDHQDDPELLAWWADPNEDVPTRVPIIELFCRHLWRDEVRKKWKRQKDPDEYAVVGVKAEGDHYVKTPKIASPINWTFDGPGDAVEVEDDLYTGSPNIARYIPRSQAVLPSGSRPSQQLIDAGLYVEDETPLAVRAVNDTQAVLGATEAKLTLFMLITGKWGFVRGKMKDLVEELNAGVSRIYGHHYEKTTTALRRLRRLGIILPDDADIELFDIRAPVDPNDVDPEQTVKWSYSTTLYEELQQGNLQTFRGWFLVNFNALMEFNGNQTRELRHYIAACAMWNDAKRPGTDEFDRSYLPRLTRAEWAARANTLSKAAVDYLAEQRGEGNRHEASRDRRKAEEKLHTLEDQGLLKVEGDTDDFIILPPDEYIEAFERYRDGQARPK